MKKLFSFFGIHAFLSVACLLLMAGSSWALSCPTTGSLTSSSTVTFQGKSVPVDSHTIAALDCTGLQGSTPDVSSCTPPSGLAPTISQYGPVMRDILNGCDPPMVVRPQQGTQPSKRVLNVGATCFVTPDSGVMNCGITNNANGNGTTP